MSLRSYTGALLACLVLTAGAGSAAADEPWISEIRYGIYQHDSGLIAKHIETGTDFAMEVLSQKVTALSLIGSPRVVFGGVLNTDGKSNQIYLGIANQWEFVHAVFVDNDAFFLEGTVGGAWTDGKLDVSGTPEAEHWKSHGSHFLFRTGADLGYRFDWWSIAISFNHISNAGLAKKNDGINDIGIRIGIRL